MRGDIEGHRVLVVGANRGLGAAVLDALREEGARVVGTARAPQPDADRFVTMDVTDEGSVQRGVAQAVEILGGLDGLVINSGINTDGRLSALEAESIYELFGVNAIGALLVYQAAVPHLEQSPAGASIVFMSSVIAPGGTVGAGIYSATKAAINSIVRTAAVELGGSGIRVNAVAPGFMQAGMGEVLMSNERLYTSYKRRIALREFGSPESVGAAVAFLISARSEYITGAVMPVDGGARP